MTSTPDVERTPAPSPAPLPALSRFIPGYENRVLRSDFILAPSPESASLIEGEAA